MDDTACVGGGERAARVNQHAGDIARRRSCLVAPVVEVLALDEFHRHKEPACEAARVVDLHKVRVLSARERLCLEHELRCCLLTVGGCDELEGDSAAELGIEGAVHSARPPDSIDHTVASDSFARSRDSDTGLWRPLAPVAPWRLALIWHGWQLA
jgi:hypothetical protein